MISRFNSTLWQRFFDQELLSAAQTAEFQYFLALFNQQSAQRGLTTGLGKLLQFVPQEALPCGQAYETFVGQTGYVPTRDHFHDRYNALIWFTAPKTKALLNRWQHDEIERLGGVTKRGALRDALTLWDENLALVIAQDHAGLLQESLKTHSWRTLFLDHRTKWHVDWHVLLFGHALMEKLHAPYKAITAHVLVIESGRQDWPVIDGLLCEWLSTQLQQSALTPRVFSSLPVIGIPGWCKENEAPGFYADAEVFRPARFGLKSRSTDCAHRTHRNPM